MSSHALSFLVLAALATGTALAVVLHRNPVRSALYLVAHMLVLAALFLKLSAQFVAAVQVVIYAGAIMVLFLFTIMLLNLSAGEIERKRFSVGFISAVVIALVLAITILGGAVWHRGLMQIATPVRDLRMGGTAEAVGFALYDPELPWLFAFELTSVILLVAAVGAVVLAGRRR